MVWFLWKSFEKDSVFLRFAFCRNGIVTRIIGFFKGL